MPKPNKAAAPQPEPTPLCRKRLMNELKHLTTTPLYNLEFQPDHSNFLLWYFLLHGTEAPFTDGMYLGRIELPHDYPMSAPSLIFLTPNGRFTINKKVCLSNTSYHNESWSQAWNLTTFILGVVSIMNEDKQESKGIAAESMSFEERQELARKSHEWNRTHHRKIYSGFTRLLDKDLNVVPLEVANHKPEEAKDQSNNQSIIQSKDQSESKEQSSSPSQSSSSKDRPIIDVKSPAQSINQPAATTSPASTNQSLKPDQTEQKELQNEHVDEKQTVNKRKRSRFESASPEVVTDAKKAKQIVPDNDVIEILD